MSLAPISSSNPKNKGNRGTLNVSASLLQKHADGPYFLFPQKQNWPSIGRVPFGSRLTERNIDEEEYERAVEIREHGNTSR